MKLLTVLTYKWAKKLGRLFLAIIVSLFLYLACSQSFPTLTTGADVLKLLTVVIYKWAK
jgi:hypothetical protein